MVLTFDIGTSEIKGALINQKGEVLSTSSVEVHLLSGRNPYVHECDPLEWLSSMAMVATKLDTKKYDEILALVVSGNGPTLVPVDKGAQPLHYALTWLDTRAKDEAQLISKIQDWEIDSSFFLPKAYWFFRHRHEIYENTKFFLSCPEFVIYYLTGNACTILPAEGYKRYIWNESLIVELGLDPVKFPPFAGIGTDVGRLLVDPAAKLGIPSDIPVIAGGPDFLVTLLGSGTILPGRTSDRAGTSEGINLCAGNPVKDKRLICLPHIIDGYYNIAGVISTTGKALDWFKDVLGEKDGSYETLFKDIHHISPGCDKLLFLPYLAGERSPHWNPLARGAFVGLSLHHSRSDMIKAIVESVGYAIRDVIEVIEENQLHVDDLRISGNQAKSPLWNQIKADITQRPILVPELEQSELMGNACVGFTTLGVYKNLKEASENMVRIGETYSPRREYRILYDDMFEIYRKVYKKLMDVFQDLNNINNPFGHNGIDGV